MKVFRKQLVSAYVRDQESQSQMPGRHIWLSRQSLMILKALYAEIFLLLPDFTGCLACCHATAIRRLWLCYLKYRKSSWVFTWACCPGVQQLEPTLVLWAEKFTHTGHVLPAFVNE